MAIEEARLQTEEARKRLNEAQAETAAAQEQLDAAQATTLSQRFRRKFAGLVGLRQRQKVNESIAQSQESINTRLQSLSNYRSQVEGAENQIKAYDKYDEDYRQAQRAMASSDPRGLTDQGREIYSKLLEGQDAAVEATFRDIEKQVGDLDSDTRRELYDTLQNNLGKVSNKEIEAKVNNIFLAKYERDKINLPQVEQVQAQTVEVPAQPSLYTEGQGVVTVAPKEGAIRKYVREGDVLAREGKAGPIRQVGGFGASALLWGYDTLRGITKLPGAVVNAASNPGASYEGTKLYFKQVGPNVGGRLLTNPIQGSTSLVAEIASIKGVGEVSKAAKAASVTKAANNAPIEFLGKADDVNLNVVAKTNVAGRDIQVIQKYAYMKDPQGNILGVKGQEIGQIKNVKKNVNEIRYREVAATNQRLNARASNVREGILSPFRLDQPVIIKSKQPIPRADGTNLFFSRGFSTNRQYLQYSQKKLNSIGLIDKVDELPSSVIKKAQVDKGSFGKNLQRSYGVYSAEQLDSLPVVRNQLVSEKVPVKNPVVKVEGGKAVMRVYKDGRVSYVVRPNVKGYVEVAPNKAEVLQSDSSLIFRQTSESVSRNFPLAAVEEGVRESVKQNLPTILRETGEQASARGEAIGSTVNILTGERSQAVPAIVKNSMEKQTQSPNLFFKETETPIEATSTKPAVRIKDVMRARNQNKQAEQPIVKPAQDFKPVEVEGTRLLFRALQKTRSAMKSKVINRPIQTPVTRPVRMPRGFGWGVGSQNKARDDKTLRDDSFTAFTLKGGKKTRLFSGSSIGDIIRKAKRSIQNDLSASLFVEDRAGRAQNLGGFADDAFKPSKKSGAFRLIEKARLRLNLWGERRAIQAAKKRKKRFSIWD